MEYEPKSKYQPQEVVHSKDGKMEIRFGIPKIRKHTGKVYYLYISGFPNSIISLPPGPSPGIGSNFLSKKHGNETN